MKKIYQTPAMEMYKANLETSLLDASTKMINTETKAEQNGTVLGNSRRTPNEDGLRDWDINLW